MSQLFVDNIKNRTGGALGLPGGAVVTGVVTATTGDFSGNVNVSGTLTYEDVTNIDSVGIVTARQGIKIGPTAGVAGTFAADGSYVTAGIITASSFVGDGSGLSGVESWNQFDTWLYGGG
jgi:hypothetical protein|tara:strand:+ start:367 stop:726 length:360 start_codon:yes stop_codon:yes gene_type:complete